MKIKSIELPHGLVLGPMAGYTDNAMRTVCAEQGADLTVTEMVSAKAICYGDKKTETLARIASTGKPCALQLFGCEPQALAEAARRMTEEPFGIKPDIIDINMGCPVRKIVSNGEGSALMSQPSLICRIVRAVTHATDLPVTVKLRTGRDAEHINAAECAMAAEQGGASAIAIHGRTAAQMYGGSICPEHIARVKQSVSVPVIGNGDIRCAADALRLMEQTGCDGVMIARGAVGNPFIFGEIAAALDGVPYLMPDMCLRMEQAKRQLLMCVSEKGERSAVLESRKQFAAYVFGTAGAAELRHRINSATRAQELICMADEITALLCLPKHGGEPECTDICDEKT